jgi:hypothetical protein
MKGIAGTRCPFSLPCRPERYRAIGASKYGPGVGDTEAVNLLGEVFSPDGGQLGCSEEQRMIYVCRA